jgi:hypothetical protein
MSEQPQGVSFAGFVMSLASTAAVHFGDIPDPAGGDQKADLKAAAQMIDIIAMLQEKTRGNLTADESDLVERLLYELRMRYVEAGQAEKRIITP